MVVCNCDDSPCCSKKEDYSRNDQNRGNQTLMLHFYVFEQKLNQQRTTEPSFVETSTHSTEETLNAS